MTSHDNSHGLVARAADGLCLAAAPVFAAMALLTLPGNGAPDMLCAGMQAAWPLNGMGLMYALMAAFHAAPWLRLMSGRRRIDRRSYP